MRAFRTWCCGAAVALLAACGGGGDSTASSTTNTTTTPPAATASLDVTVYDTVGRFVQGATVSTGAAQVDTDAKGHATIAVVAGAEQALTIDKSGFAEQVKVVNLPANATSGVLQAMVIARQPTASIASVENGGTATGRHGVSVTFPPNALIDNAGRAVTGTVDMLMTPVDVTDVDVGAFPGLFEGIPTGGARAAIVSYGTSELVPTQGGAKLALAAGKTATIELPIYVTTHQDGSTVKAGDAIPLWSLDTSTGLWKQEGTGTIVANGASPTGLTMRATIGHFSWWNGDASSLNATVQLTVTASSASVPANTSAPVDATVVAGSGPSSAATTTVTVGTTVSLRVPANATTRLHTRFDLPTQVCEGTVSVSPAAGSTVPATLNGICTDVPVPTIVRPAALTATNSASDLAVDINVTGPVPGSVELLVDGASIAQMPAQFFYRVFWHSASFGEGLHTLAAKTTLQGVTRLSAAVTVVVDRTPPQVASVQPGATIEVDQNTTFTVTLDEPVNALPFGLANAVQLTVVPPGQTQPVVIPANVQLDSSGQQLTVQATAPLPIGVAGVSWGGLQDAAGNAVTGTVGATWNVLRFAQVGDGIRFSGPSMGAALDANGVPLLLRRRQNDTNLEVITLVSGAFVPMGPVINDRPASGDASIAVKGGQIWVAFSQDDVAGTGADVRVRRFDAATNTWVTPGNQTFAVQRAGTSNAIHPRIALDAQGLPTLVFIGSTGGQFDLQGFHFDGTNWVPLGSFGTTLFNGMVMALDNGGHPVVATARGFVASNAEQLQVVRHDGTNWVLLGNLDSSSSGNEFIADPSIAMDPNGRAWVAWKHFPSATLSISAFDGTSFVPVAVPADFDAPNGNVGLTFLNGEPVAAGIGFNGLDVRRLRNGTWEGPDNVTAASQTGVIVLLPTGPDVIAVCEGIAGLGLVDRVFFP